LAFQGRLISPPISWRSLLTLIVPFTLAYLVLLLPRGISRSLYDRYLLLLLPIALILLIRLYQDRIRSNLPLASTVLVLLVAACAIAGTHDIFALYRARLAAADELRAAGIPDTSIDGGLEHNGMIQIERSGYMNDPRVHFPATARFTNQPSLFPEHCRPYRDLFTPAIVPGYSLSFDPAACGGPSRFAPVTYRNWVWPRTITIYIVNTVRPTSGQR
jgi:hypothetical protein